MRAARWFMTTDPFQCPPEAAEGGTIGLLKEGDIIECFEVVEESRKLD